MIKAFRMWLAKQLAKLTIKTITLANFDNLNAKPIKIAQFRNVPLWYFQLISFVRGES